MGGGDGGRRVGGGLAVGLTSTRPPRTIISITGWGRAGAGAPNMAWLVSTSAPNVRTITIGMTSRPAMMVRRIGWERCLLG